MLVGKRTYISIVITLLGSFGVFDKLGITSQDFGDVLDSFVTFIGGCCALYYNWLNHQKK